MATLAQVIASRRRDLRAIQKLMRAVDSAQEKSERKIKSLLSRKRKVPEIADLDSLVLAARDVDAKLSEYVDGLAGAAKVWIL
jgi:hypothetical protein